MNRLPALRRPGLRRRGQAMTETIILIALCGLALAFLVTALPQALSSHYVENQKVLASPL